MKQNDVSWQFTDSKAGSGPDLGGAVQAFGPGVVDPACVEEGALSEQATCQGSALQAG